MDEVNCPRCGGDIARDANLVGQTVACPFCSHNFVMPAADPATAATMHPGAAPPAPPVATTGNPYPAPVPAAGTGVGFECPYCHTRSLPLVRSQISTAGWAVFVALLLFCLPLFWIGLLIKEDYRVCSHCGIRLG